MQIQYAVIIASWAVVLLIASLACGEEPTTLRTDTASAQANDSAPTHTSSTRPLPWRPSRKEPASKGAASAPVINVGLSRVPKLGFRSTFGDVGGAKGELIREVQLGSPADRMKLLPGDVIVAVNGAPLVDANSWYGAITKAQSRDGWVTLKIRTARTGAVEYRTVNLLKLPAQW